SALGHVDGLAAKALGLRKSFRDQVANDDASRAEQLGTRCACQADRAGSSDVDGAARSHAGADCSVKASGENGGKARQVLDLGHGLSLVRELEEIEIRIRHHYVISLAADPTTHVDIAIRGAGTSRVYVQADARSPLLTVTAAAAGDIKGDGAQVA